MSDTGALILCFDLSNSCWNCDEPLRGEPVEDRYCSTVCLDEAKERQEDDRARLACCVECGYDQLEHNPTCSRATALDSAKEVATMTEQITQAEIRVILADVYTPEGIDIWWVSRNANLYGLSPRTMFEVGSGNLVLVEAERLAGLI